MECPHCNQEINLALKELESHAMYMVLKHEGEFLQAKTVGGIITDTEKLLKATARESGCGGKIMVAFGGIETSPGEVKIKFIVMNKAKK